MARIRWYGPAVVLLVTVILVMVAGPGLVRNIAWAHRDQEIRLIKNELAHNGTLAEMSEAFRNVAKVVEPSVVHVLVYKKGMDVRSRRFHMDPLERFFGPREEPRNEDEDNEKYQQFNVPRESGNGSGWVYEDGKHIITNYHVVRDADEIEIRFPDGTERQAAVVNFDAKTDIAVLKVEGGKLHGSTLAGEPVEQGDIVFAFGSPFRFEFSMSQGIVSAKGRELHIIDRGRGYEMFIQTDAAINPGNSGGPLTNIYGEVVGMNTAIATRTGSYNGLGFAIPIEMIRDVVDQIIDQGRVIRGFLGIYIDDLDEKLAATYGFEGEGVLVLDPIEGSPAAEAGIQRDDIVTQIDGQPATSTRQLRNRVARLKPGEKVELTVFRNGETKKITVTIGELPADPQVASRDMPSADEPEAGQVIEQLHKYGLESMQTMTRLLAERLGADFQPGVVIEDVRRGSSAAAAGLQPGVIVTDVMGKTVGSVEELVKEMEALDLDKPIRLGVLQNSVRRVVLLELPED